MTLNDDSQQEVFSESDKKFMKLALKLALKAQEKGEIPIGALVVSPENKILGWGYNIREIKQLSLGHAELVALHRASKKINSWRLQDCTLYVTLEPCLMCAGAISQTRIKRVVYATNDPKGGALGSLYNFSQDQRLNHRYTVHSGLFKEISSQLLKNFFKLKRKIKKNI